MTSEILSSSAPCLGFPTAFVRPLFSLFACLAWLAEPSLVRAQDQQALAPPASGQDLAAELCSAAPEEGSTVRGTIHIHSGAYHASIPLVGRIEAGSNSWRTVYDAGHDHFVVIHSTNGPNQYLASVNGGPTNSIPADQAALPLAGSDFSLADLGLDFLHWPIQELGKGEMRLGQPCYVLDSSRPASAAPDGITHIRSYIDKQTGGILMAEAYGPGGAVLKSFSLHGSFFRKVNGQWRLEKMEMSDRRKHSQTIIQFDTNQ